MVKWFSILAVSCVSFLFGEVHYVSDRAQHIDPEKLAVNGHSTEWISSVKEEKVVLLIHGYNNDYEEAKNFYAPMLEKLDPIYDTTICYFWPGFDDFWEYMKARNMSTHPALSFRLHNLLKDLKKQTKQVDIIAFSTGCRLALEALKRSDEPLIENLFLLAPAVDNEALEKKESYFQSTLNSGKTFVFYSKNDPVLRWGYPLLEWDKALGSVGPQNWKKLSPSTHIIDSSLYVKHHHDYSTSEYVFNVISNAHSTDQLATAQ